MKKLIILATLLITGCNSIAPLLNTNGVPIKPNDLSYKILETRTSVEYKIQSEKLEYDIRVKAQCDSDKQKYSFSFMDKNSDKRAYQPQWYLLFNGSIDGRSRQEYDEIEYLNKVTNIQVTRYKYDRFRRSKPPQRFDLTAPELLNLPALCKNKYTQFQEDLAKRRKQKNEHIKQKNEKDAQLVASVKNSTGLEPMFSGNNEKSFNELVNIFRANGFSQYKNKFVWADDGNYKVSQVFDGKVILTASYHFELPPITIVTNLPALEGQFWSSISRAPLKFVGVTNHTTVLGASKQSIVLQQFN